MRARKMDEKKTFPSTRLSGSWQAAGLKNKKIISGSGWRLEKNKYFAASGS